MSIKPIAWFIKLQISLVCLGFSAQTSMANAPRSINICQNSSVKHFIIEHSQGGGTIIGFDSRSNSLTILNCPLESPIQGQSEFLTCRKSFEGPIENFCSAEINYYNQQLKAIGYINNAQTINRMTQPRGLIQTLIRLEQKGYSIPALFKQTQINVDCYNKKLIDGLIQGQTWQRLLSQMNPNAFEVMRASDIGRVLPIVGQFNKNESQMIKLLDFMNADRASRALNTSRLERHVVGTIRAIHAPPNNPLSDLRLSVSPSAGAIHTELATLSADARSRICDSTTSTRRVRHDSTLTTD